MGRPLVISRAWDLPASAAGPGDGGEAAAGGWSKMSDEPVVREREPIERVRARLEALVKGERCSPLRCSIQLLPTSSQIKFQLRSWPLVSCLVNRHQRRALGRASAITHGPQFRGFKDPKIMHGHIGHAAPCHEPIIDISRVLHEHPYTSVDGYSPRRSISSEMKLQRSVIAKAQALFWNDCHDHCAGGETRAANLDITAGLYEFPPTLHMFVKNPARFEVEHRSGLGPRAIPSTRFSKRVCCAEPTVLEQHENLEELRDSVRIFPDLLGGVDPRTGTKSEYESKGAEPYVAFLSWQ